MKKFLAALLMVAASMGASQAADSGYAAKQKAYLVENAKKPGWKTTASGLQYHPIKTAAAGAEQAPPGAIVTVHYEGKFIDGKTFDSSYARKEPATFPLGGVIQGWGEGVPLMKVGDIYEFAIPANLAYGDQGRGPEMPGGATLLFKIELIYINK